MKAQKRFWWIARRVAWLSAIARPTAFRSPRTSVNIRRFDGDVGAAADGEADIGLRQRRGVIDAVADHSHARAFRLHLLDRARFIRRQHFRHDALNADFAGDCGGGLLIVAGDEGDVKTARF